MHAIPPIWKHPVHFLAFGFGSGLAPRAPGTAGTIAAIPCWYGLWQYLPVWHYLLVLTGCVAIGIWLCGKTARDLGVHDHPGIVWDEFCGYWLTMLAAPTGWCWVVLGLGLFRLFDIAKPWPIGWLDAHIQGGLGIMLDDVVAGGYAWVVLQLIAQFV